jgi:hypothetical protein
VAEPVAVGMNEPWTLYVTDQAGVRQGQLDVYETAEIVGRTNDVSTWQVTLPTDTEAGAAFLADTHARLEVAFEGEVWRSGPMSHLERTVDIDGDSLLVGGVDDTIWLARRVAHPQPQTATPPYNAQAQDVQTGAMSTVIAGFVDRNAGPSAVPARRVPGLVIPPPLPVGPSVTVYGRWQNLLGLMADTARPTDVIFDVVDLALEVHLAVDRGVVFSQGLETLGKWVQTANAASVNKTFVGGSGVGTARTIREMQHAESIADWGVAEQFLDRRDTSDVTELDKAQAEAIAAGVVPTTVVFSPLDTPGQEFGADWALGDKATVIAGGLTVFDQIREVHVQLDEEGVTVIPSVGSPAGDLALFRSLAGLERRVRQLERV